MSAYRSFAYFYDKLTANVDYSNIADRIDCYVRRFGGRRGILLDLACGTGSLSEKLASAGYDVIGVDGSVEMLNCALDKKYESGLDIQYLCQDMRQLDMYGTVDVVVCVLDSINHLESAEDVLQVFERVSLFAFPDGMFIFDVNTLHKHRDVLADNAYIYNLDGVYCGWQNEYNKTDSSVDVYLDFFEEEGGAYRRYTESFSEIYISDEDVRKMLGQSGFEVLGVFDDYTDDAVSGSTERAVYVCRKIK